MEYFFTNFQMAITQPNLGQFVKSQTFLNFSFPALQDSGIGLWIWLSLRGVMKGFSRVIIYRRRTCTWWWCDVSCGGPVCVRCEVWLQGQLERANQIKDRAASREPGRSRTNIYYQDWLPTSTWGLLAWDPSYCSCLSQCANITALCLNLFSRPEMSEFNIEVKWW